MSGIPLTRAGLLQPFFQSLNEAGAPVERGLERAKLPVRCHEDPGCYVATHAQMAFVSDVGFREGIEDFGWKVGASAGASSLGDVLTARLSRAPSLFQAIKTLCMLANTESSHVKVWVETSPAGIYLHERSTFRPGTVAGQDEMTLWRSRTILEILRGFTSPDWVPAAIGLAIEGNVSQRIAAELGDTPIYISRDTSWQFLPLSLFSKPFHTTAHANGKLWDVTSAEPVGDFESSMSRLLAPYLSERGISIDWIAEAVGMSRRSLQRRLAEQHLSYSTLLDNVRFKRAIELMEDPALTMTDIAHETGYTDSSNFSRAFRRIGGINPRLYRSKNFRRDDD